MHNFLSADYGESVDIRNFVSFSCLFNGNIKAKPVNNILFYSYHPAALIFPLTLIIAFLATSFSKVA
jgi:hypothetical protein